MDRLAIFETLAKEFDVLKVRDSKTVYDSAVRVARGEMLEMRGYIRGGQAHLLTTHVQAENLVRDWAGIENPPSNETHKD